MLKPIKALIVGVCSLMILAGCTTTEVARSSKESKEREVLSKNTISIYGKWALIKIVTDEGEVQDYTSAPANFIYIKEAEISEKMPGFGVKNYNYIRQGNTLIIMAGNRLSSWSIVKHTINILEIQTAAGKYVLSR